MQSAFLNALNPGDHSCFGLTLQPLTLGHVYLFHRFNLPPATGEPFTLDSIALCAFICHRPWRKFITSRRSWTFKVWGWLCARCNLPVHIQRFHRYLGCNLCSPTWKSSGNGKPVAAPYYFRVMALAMAELHLPKADALDIPFCELTALIAALNEVRGDADLETEADLSFWKFAEEQDRLKGYAKNN